MGGKETGWVEGADTQSIDFSNSSRVPQLASGQLATFSNWVEEVVVWKFVSGDSLSKPSWFSNITKMNHTASLNLTSVSFHLNLGFISSSLTVTT